MSRPAMTPEEALAVVRAMDKGTRETLAGFVEFHGRQWAGRLALDWMRAAAPACLHRLRNARDVGTRWLDAVAQVEPAAVIEAATAPLPADLPEEVAHPPHDPFEPVSEDRARSLALRHTAEELRALRDRADTAGDTAREWLSAYTGPVLPRRQRWADLGWLTAALEARKALHMVEQRAAAIR